jgi:hypothetical protein
MEVFEIIYEYSPNDSKEILTERNYWTAPSLVNAALVASRHAEEYEKDLVSIRHVLTITQQLENTDEVSE